MALIVEFFGPPGSGKTTFARALAERLRADGLPVGLHLSSRPGEDVGGPTAAGVNRIARPIWELISTAAIGRRRPTPGAFERLAPFLSSGVRPTKRLRMKQYLFRLATAWAGAEAGAGIFIFDQAYLQFVATLFALKVEVGQGDLRDTLSAAPQADVAIRFDAAPGELARRLEIRSYKVGAFGRFLEAGAGSRESYLAVSRLLQQELEDRGRTVLKTWSSNDDSFGKEIERVAEGIFRLQNPASPLAELTESGLS